MVNNAGMHACGAVGPAKEAEREVASGYYNESLRDNPVLIANDIFDLTTGTSEKLKNVIGAIGRRLTTLRSQAPPGE